VSLESYRGPPPSDTSVSTEPEREPDRYADAGRIACYVEATTAATVQGFR
jgi:hypothetical protein